MVAPQCRYGAAYWATPARRLRWFNFTEKVNKKFQCTLDYVVAYSPRGRRFLRRSRNGWPDGYKDSSRSSFRPRSRESRPRLPEMPMSSSCPTSKPRMLSIRLSLFRCARIAALLIGTTAPVVTPSRADSADNKYFSLALACVAGHYEL